MKAGGVQRDESGRGEEEEAMMTVAAGKRADLRSPQGGWRMGAVMTKSAKTRGGNYDGGGNVVSQKQAVG